jgi:5-methyltetrahydropteroyltriglutamate--homocysteine methyltransferase
MLATNIVGGLPRPRWLADPSDVFTSWRPALEHLAETQDDAVRVAVADQEEPGLDIVTDGEQPRVHYVWGFGEGCEGIDFGRRVPMAMRGGRYTRPAPVGFQTLAEAAPGHVAHVRSLVIDVLSPGQLRRLGRDAERIMARIDTSEVN